MDIEPVQPTEEPVYDAFPEKPEEETRQQSINHSIISMLLFIGAAYWIFKLDLKNILVLTGVILIHETGHYLAMRMFHYKDLGIFFIPLIGAYATGTKENISQKQSIIILLAGPLPGIIIGLVLYFFGLENQNHFLVTTAIIFVFLNLLNLLPILPLDGGRVIKSLFFESNETVSKVFILISAAAVIYYAVTAKDYFLLIIPFFSLMQLAVMTEIKQVKVEVQDKGISLDKSYSELTNEEYWLIRDEIGTHIKYFSRSITPGDYTIADNEQRIVRQVKAIIQKKPVKDLETGGKILVVSIWVLSFIIPLIAIAWFYSRLGINVFNL